MGLREPLRYPKSSWPPCRDTHILVIHTTCNESWGERKRDTEREREREREKKIVKKGLFWCAHSLLPTACAWQVKGALTGGWSH
jgi:hypothetical protein